MGRERPPKSGSQSQNKQKLALEMLEDHREKCLNKIARDIMEYKAEKAENIKENYIEIGIEYQLILVSYLQERLLLLLLLLLWRRRRRRS